MGQQPTDPSSEPGLHEYMDAEFTVEGLDSLGREKALRDALANVSGLESLSISRAKVTAHYEPVLLSKTQLEEEIQRAGFRIAKAKTTACSALTDALKKNLQTLENDSESRS
jgi:hypothetical protein